MRYIGMEVSHWLANTGYHISHNRCRLSKNKMGFISGKPGTSAITNVSDQAVSPFINRAPIILTSSAHRSPDPWNHAVSKSPLGNSTIVDPCTCWSWYGKMILDTNSVLRSIVSVSFSHESVINRIDRKSVV